MIGFVRGEIVALGELEAVIEAHGVGWRVLVGPQHRQSLEHGAAVAMHVSTQVRQDSIELFGFRSLLERRVFEILITMPKIGPRLGLAIADALGPEKLAHAIATDDVRALEQVSGVGKKTAQRLLIDLKGKLPVDFSVLVTQPAAKARPDDALPLALARLGYRKSEIDTALAGLEARGMASADLQTRLGESLRILSGAAT